MKDKNDYINLINQAVEERENYFEAGMRLC